jgi:sulfite reductase (ferredoxin)
MGNEEIFVSHDAYQILKYHGSYQQDDREMRKRPEGKAWQFMLRLKVPCGEVTPEVYRLLDDYSTKYGENTLRATTRQAWQLHGILKGDLKTVIGDIMKIGSSTVGACGDVSRNVMTTPAPLVSKPYKYAREYSKVMAELFKPTSVAFSEIWLDGEEEKAAKIEYWRKDIDDEAVQAAYHYDNGRGVVLPHHKEPLYGSIYLPRKFKIGVTVPGDNSMDLYINDIGLVVITDPDNNDDLLGFNVAVGGGMGRTHNKESTFAKAAQHLGFVEKDDVMEVCKAILAVQRDHGNREVRANARMKYLVHNLGIDGFKDLVESYFGKQIAPWREMVPWRYSDWMGWHEQGDGKLFVGIHLEAGRVKDSAEVQWKTFLRKVVDKYDIPMVLSPTQSVIFKDIKPEDKAGVEALMAEHGVQQIEEVDPLDRLAMGCPALPLCGLAMTEAERVIPSFTKRMRGLLNKVGLPAEEIMIRMTGCPNGCARPYMAELAFVGEGVNQYQVWVGGSPVLAERTGFPYKSKVKAASWEDDLEPLLVYFKEQRLSETEFFGDFCHRVGQEALAAYAADYKVAEPVTNEMKATHYYVDHRTGEHVSTQKKKKKK